jgi:tetratricopeptide (TPR) repeat protein
LASSLFFPLLPSSLFPLPSSSSLSAHQKTKIISALAILRIKKPEDKSTAQLLFNIGAANWRKREFQEAISLYVECLELRRKLLPRDHDDMITTLNALGATYLSAGEKKNALPYFLEALEIRKFSQTPQNIPDTAMLWNNLGLVYMEDNHEAALQAFQEALALFRKAGFPDLAILLKNIGVLHKLLGDVPKAFQFFQESLAAYQKDTSPSRDLASIMELTTELGNIYSNFGDLPNGVKYLTATLELHRLALPPTHPRIAAILNSIATLYQSQGEHAPAMPILRESLEICQKAAPGVVYPATFAEIFNNLGVGSQNLGDLEASVQYFQEALEYSRKVVPLDVEILSSTINNLVLLYRRMGQGEKGLPYFLEILEIHRQTRDPDHPAIAGALFNLGIMYGFMKEYEKGIPALQECIVIWKKMNPLPGPEIARALSSLANLYIGMSDTERAIPFYLEAVEILREVGPPENPEFISTLRHAVQHSLSTGQITIAIPLLEELLAIHRKILPAGHHDLAPYLYNLAMIYHQLGQNEKSLEYYLEVFAIFRTMEIPPTDLIRMLAEVSGVYYALQNNKKCAETLEELIELARDVIPPDHPEMVQYLYALGYNYVFLKRFREALQMFQKIYTLTFNHDDPHFRTSLLQQIADMHQRLGDLRKGLRALQDALEIQEKVEPPVTNTLVELLGTIGAFHEALGEQEKAWQMRLKAMDLQLKEGEAGDNTTKE